MALDEIARNLALSSGRMTNNDPASNTCCRLLGAEFLTTKFWRRSEGRNSSRFFVPDLQNLTDQREARGLYTWGKWRVGVQNGLLVNPLAEINPHTGGNSEIAANKMQKSAVHENEITRTHHLK